jgi:flagellar hook-associated protein 3 FlgL
MTRIATIPLQRTMSDAIQKSQQKLARTQVSLATGKKALDYASLGTQTVRNLSAHTLVSREETHKAVTTRVGTTLELTDTYITALDDRTTNLHTDLLAAIGTGQSAGLQCAIEAAFSQYRSSLNASEGGIPLFAGSQTDSPPFKPQTLADTLTMTPAQAFTNDQVKATARVGTNLDVEYGVLASEFGGGELYAAFQTLAAAGPIGDVLTPAQSAALGTAAGQIQEGLKSLRSVNSANGRKQAQLEDLGSRSAERIVRLRDIISENEDADLGQIATDLATQKTTLEASFSVFSQLSGLSLVQYLR